MKKKSKDEKKKDEKDDNSDESCSDKEISLLSRKLKKLIRSRKARDGRLSRKYEKKKHYKKDSSSDEDKKKKKKDEIVCYGCKKPRHIKSECPGEKGKKKYFQGKKKCFVATCDQAATPWTRKAASGLIAINDSFIFSSPIQQ
ncbi:hypothetical protein Dimus_024945 [Dionaea muscipula]